MRLLASLLCVSLLVAASARAEWAIVDTEELVSESDLIVEAVLVDVRATHRPPRDDKIGARVIVPAWDYGSGVLKVRRTLLGSAKPGAKLQLRWDNPTALVCPRVEWAHAAKKPQIWLLQTRKDGTVRADYPGRAVELSELPKVRRLIAQRRPSRREASQ